MKQIVSNYSYSPATNVVTLTGLNVDADQLLLIVAPQVGRTMYNFASVTGVVSAGADTRITLNASTAGLTTTSPLVIFYDDQAGAQSVTGTVALDPASLIALENVTVTVGSSVSISNFPSTQTIAGTVTANGRSDIYDSASDVYWTKSVIAFGNPFAGEPTLVEQATPLPISGTVTANVFGTGYNNILYSLPIGQEGTDAVTRGVAIGFHENLTADEFRSVKASDPFPVQIRAGTVTVGAMPNGSLTTRFGSVTTANTAQITSAVTNTSRKYLLAQNISAATVTIGIGFSPTTTQGIQLTAGAGLTFDAFAPTGAIYWLGAVTGAAFTILEG
jgi:hypothetical protein